MVWEIGDPFPPGKVEDYKKDYRYKRTVFQLGKQEASFCETQERMHSQGFGSRGLAQTLRAKVQIKQNKN